MANPRFAAAVAVQKNNQGRGSIPKAKSLVGGAHSVGPEPSGDYDEVDALHRALGSAIVDKVMKSREEKMAHGGQVGPQEDEDGDFLDGDQELDFNDDMNSDSGDDESEGEDEAGEGEGGTTTQGPILSHIMASIRRKHLGR